MSAHAAWEYRLALHTARRLRTCPLRAPADPRERGSQWLRHLERCPDCAEAHEGAPGSVEPLWAPDLGPPEDTQAGPPEVGDIRSVRRDLGGWGPGDRHFNPPLVLVVDRLDDLEDAVRVAQVYDDPTLMGPGDVLVPLEDEEAFVETWNTYSLRAADLGPRRAVLDPETLATVRRACARPPALKDAATDDPYLAAFRRIEVEAAAFFALQALPDLLAQGEAPAADEHETRLFAPIERRFSDWPTLSRYLHERQPNLILPKDAPSIADGLLQIGFPDRCLARAAATVERIEMIRVLQWRGDELRIETGLAEIRLWRVEGDSLTVGGRYSGPMPDQAVLYARFQKPDGRMQAPAEVDFSPEGYFRLSFTGLSAIQIAHGRLLAVVGGR